MDEYRDTEAQELIMALEWREGTSEEATHGRLAVVIREYLLLRGHW
jgi:hypothetical protein